MAKILMEKTYESQLSENISIFSLPLSEHEIFIDFPNRKKMAKTILRITVLLLHPTFFL
jgi:hypothetical protein